MFDSFFDFILDNLPKLIFILGPAYKIFDRIGYFLIILFKNVFLSILFALAYATTYVAILSSNSKDNSEIISELIYQFFLSLTVLFIVFAIIQIVIEYRYPKSAFRYVRYSVKNNIIDNCIWSACTSGQLIKIITKSNEEFIVFPKYSSSYECKITGKKHLRAFILKKGNVNNNGKAEYYEDNTRLILKKLDDLSHKIEKQKLKKIRSNEFLFEPLENKLEASYKCFLLNKPYPKVPFYQILSEFEDRIDFKDIASISIYCPSNTYAEDKYKG